MRSRSRCRRLAADDATTPAAETAAAVDATVVDPRSSIVEATPVGRPESAVPASEAEELNEEEEEEEEPNVVDELGDRLHRGNTLLADGRLELCQLSKLLQCIRARDVRMIDNLVSKGVPHLLDYAHPADNETTLGLTASRNDDTLLTHLIQLGADPNVADVSGRTAAMRAAEYGHLQSMNILAEAGIDMKLVDDSGQGRIIMTNCMGAGRNFYTSRV